MRSFRNASRGILISEFAVFAQHPLAFAGWFFPVRGFGKFKFERGAGIDDRNTVVLPLADEMGGGVGLVNMTVDHDSGMIPVQQGSKAFEAPVCHILLVAQAADRRMGQKNVKAAG